MDVIVGWLGREWESVVGKETGMDEGNGVVEVYVD